MLTEPGIAELTAVDPEVLYLQLEATRRPRGWQGPRPGASEVASFFTARYLFRWARRWRRRPGYRWCVAILNSKYDHLKRPHFSTDIDTSRMRQSPLKTSQAIQHDYACQYLAPPSFVRPYHPARIPRQCLKQLGRSRVSRDPHQQHSGFTEDGGFGETATLLMEPAEQYWPRRRRADLGTPA